MGVERRFKKGSYVAAALLLLTGVSGPLNDTYFLGGKLDRRQIVATKAVCQVFGHAAKFIYFGALIDQAAALEPLPEEPPIPFAVPPRRGAEY